MGNLLRESCPLSATPNHKSDSSILITILFVTKMKIYFAGSIRGGRQDVHLYHDIIKQLRDNYGEVLTEFVGDKNITALEGTAQKTDKEIHDDDVAMLSECTCLVAEVTQPSLGVGYEIGRAVAMDKKILC